MNRRTFLTGLGLSMMPLGSGVLANLKQSLPDSATVPVLFIGHGSPMMRLRTTVILRAGKRLANRFQSLPLFFVFPPIG